MGSGRSDLQKTQYNQIDIKYSIKSIIYNTLILLVIYILVNPPSGLQTPDRPPPPTGTETPPTGTETKADFFATFAATSPMSDFQLTPSGLAWILSFATVRNGKPPPA